MAKIPFSGPIICDNNFYAHIISISANVKRTAKLSKFGVTRCQILRLNAPNSISAGALSRTPDPAGENYSALQNALAVFKGPAFKGREGKGERRRRKGKHKGKRKKGKRRGGKGKGLCA